MLHTQFLRCGIEETSYLAPMNLRMEQVMDELNKMKKELKLAIEAEEKSRKAMDDLASVLQEVAAEANEAKQNLKATKSELKAVKDGKEQIRLKLESTEEKLASVMAERNEFKNAAERLRLEADETLSNWNVKESGLVECMKKVEEERSKLETENLELLEEMKKLRDIFKQAMTEAITAKEDANVAKGKNSKLIDQLAGKDTALNFISRELESLRASEAAARRDLNDLKLQLAESSTVSSPDSKTQKEQQEIKPLNVRKKKTFSFDLGCSGRHKWLAEAVNENTNKVNARNVGRDGTRDNAMRLTGNMSCRFANEGKITKENGLDSLSKRSLSKRFVGLISGINSKSKF